MKLCVCLLLLLSCIVSPCSSAGRNWAMLFTGAHFWENYSTHANLCHAYQVLHKAGIPDDRIVTVMYNDIADSPKNPYPGKLFNNYNHTDVYRGTPMDYTGKEVTADLVLAVLQGDKATVKSLLGREGKVVDSGPEDNVFVAVSDHGGPGCLLMPDRLLVAKELHKALLDMHSNKKFANLIFYLESCYSGSMFSNLPHDINIYAITSSHQRYESFMNYCCDPHIKTVCLGGQFSTAWTENSDRVDINTFTFRQQAQAIGKVVNMSHPELFGDQALLKRPLKDFFGATPTLFQDVPSTSRHAPNTDKSNTDTAPFHLMELSLIKRQIELTPTDINLRLQLARLQALVAEVDKFYTVTARHVYPDESWATLARLVFFSSEQRITNWDCYEKALHTVSVSCNGLVQHPKVQGYFLSKLSILVNLCNRHAGSVVAHAVEHAARHISLCSKV